MFTDPTSNAAFLNTQLQSAGYFQLADDEALVLTIDPNDAGYFVVPVTNDWTITENYWDQQTSLNNAAKPCPMNSAARSTRSSSRIIRPRRVLTGSPPVG